MDLIHDEYNTDEEAQEKNTKKGSRVLDLSGSGLNLAPIIEEPIDKDETGVHELNTKSEVFKNPYNSLIGHVEKRPVDPFTFEEQYHTFKNYGYAANPADDFNFSIIGDKNKFEEFDGSTIFSCKSLKKKKYKKAKREKMGDPSDIDGYKGPWAKFDDDETELAECRERQEIMKKLFEDKNKKDKNGVSESVKSKNTEKETSDNHSSKGEKEADKNNGDQKETKKSHVKETNVFEYIEEKDYLGRTYMHCPHEFRTRKEPWRCYIPSKHIHTWRDHRAAVTAIRFFPGTGHILLSASLDKTLKIWDVNTHRRCLRTLTGHSKGIRDIDFSPDGRKFLSVGHDEWIKIWDTETGKVINRIEPDSITTTARFNPLNDNEILSGQVDKNVVGWDLKKGEIIQKYNDHNKAVIALVFFDNGRKFASAGDDKKILIWEYGIPVVLNHISEPYMNTMPFITKSPDGEWFLGQSMDNSIIVYGATDNKGKRKRKYIGHKSAGYACQTEISPDGKFLMSGDSEGRVFFWDFKTKRIYKRLKAHNKVTVGAIWHPIHQSKVATCSWDGTIKYWD